MEEARACGLMVKQIHDALEKQANNALRGKGLTLAQLSLLMELCGAPEQTASLKELEKVLHVAQSTTAGIVARLEQKGFLASVGDPDRRIKLVRLTPLGERCCADAKQNMDDAEERLLSGLTQPERALFHQLLTQVSRGL